jgi:hypothetical protein
MRLAETETEHRRDHAFDLNVPERERESLRMSERERREEDIHEDLIERGAKRVVNIQTMPDQHRIAATGIRDRPWHNCNNANTVRK